MTKKIVAIWAQDQNGLIGKNQSLPWHLPAELKHFKEITSGHAILMGRVTFDGMDQRVLPNRTSLILTKDPNYTVENESVLIFHDLPSVLKWYQEQEKNLYIIGGGQIFSLFQHHLDEIIKKDYSLDLGLIKDESLLDIEALPNPILNTNETIEKLEEAIDLLKLVVNELKNCGLSEED